VAATAAAHVVAQTALAVVFAAVMARGGVRAGVLAGAAAFAGVSLLVTGVPAAVATAAAVPALLVAPRLMAAGAASPRRDGAARPGPAWTATALGAAVAFALVASALAAARFLGPAAAGTVGAFPAVSTALAFVIARTRGRHAAAGSLRGMTVGLRGYLAFCLTVAATAAVLGVAGAVALGLAACGVTYVLLTNSGPCRAPSSRSTCSRPRRTRATRSPSYSTAKA
jgi:hypothetical protein